MRHLIKLSILVFILNACSDSNNSQEIKQETTKKDYLEEYYELEEERYEAYLDSMAG